jgi:hypothetical protein
MGLRVESVFWLNVERVCSFLPAFCLCLGDRFTVFVSGQRGRLRGGVCGSVGLHTRKVVFSSFYRFFSFSGKGLSRLKCSHYRNYRLYSSCVFAAWGVERRGWRGKT